MRKETFETGKIYFMGGYHDPQRTVPCVIKPVIYVGKDDSSSAKKLKQGFSRYIFEDLESWFERKGKGAANPKNLHHVEGPPEMTLVMDIDQLIKDLTHLRTKLQE